jgi:hypothetical protein
MTFASPGETHGDLEYDLYIDNAAVVTDITGTGTGILGPYDFDTNDPSSYDTNLQYGDPSTLPAGYNDDYTPQNIPSPIPEPWLVAPVTAGVVVALLALPWRRPLSKAFHSSAPGGR